MPRLFRLRRKNREQDEPADKFVYCSLVGDEQVGKTTLVHSYLQGVLPQQHTPTVFENELVPVEVGEETFTISLFDTSGLMNHESLRAFTYEKSEVLVVCFSLRDPQSFYNVLQCWLPEIQRHRQRRLPLLLVGTQKDLRDSDLKRNDLGVVWLTRQSPRKPAQTADDSKGLVQTLGDPQQTQKVGESSCRAEASLEDAATNQQDLGGSDWDHNYSKSPSQGHTNLTYLDPELVDLKASPGQVSEEEGQYLAKIIGADCYIECSAKSREGLEEVFRHVVLSALKYRANRRKIFKRVKEDVLTYLALPFSSCGLPKAFRFAKTSSC